MKAKGYARVEYLALADDVRAKLHAGYTVKAIYDELVASGKVTMSYRMFCRYASGKTIRTPPSLPLLAPILVPEPSQSSEKFIHNKNPHMERPRLMGPEKE